MAKPAYVQEIESAIDDVRSLVRRHGDYFQDSLEWHARYLLIDPMLKALGWDVGNPEQVWVEYGTDDGGRADYAFFKPGSETPLMIIEAKKTKNPDYALDSSLEWFSQKDKDPEGWVYWKDEEVAQLEGYTESMTDGYGVLTDGIFWSVYDLSMPGQFADKLEAYFCILIPPAERSADVLKKLHRRNLR